MIGRQENHIEVKRKKILFIAHIGGIAGAERVLIEIVCSLREGSFEPLVTVPEEGDLKRELEACGAKVLLQPIGRWIPYKPFNERHHLRTYLEGLPSRVKQLVRIIQDEDVAVVHSNVGVVLEGALAAKLTRRPHVWHQHSTFRNDPNRELVIPHSLTAGVFRTLSDVNLCCSSFTAKELFPAYLQQNVRVFYNGINVEKLTPDGPERDLRLELGLSHGTPLVGLLGTVYERKGQLDFVEAAARVRTVIPEANFVFAGHDPPPRTYLQILFKRIEELNASNYVRYLGYRHDYVDIMKSLDISVLASTVEMLPLVVLEAMACGRPVVATRSGGTAEAVLDGETGLLVDVGNVQQLADAIINVLSRPDMRRSMGVKGRERVTKVFDQRKCLRSLPPLYQELLERRDAQRIRNRIRVGPAIVSAFLMGCTHGPKAFDTLRRSMKRLGFPIPEHIQLD